MIGKIGMPNKNLNKHRIDIEDNWIYKPVISGWIFERHLNSMLIVDSGYMIEYQILYYFYF